MWGVWTLTGRWGRGYWTRREEGRSFRRRTLQSKGPTVVSIGRGGRTQPRSEPTILLHTDRTSSHTTIHRCTRVFTCRVRTGTPTQPTQPTHRHTCRSRRYAYARTEQTHRLVDKPGATEYVYGQSPGTAHKWSRPKGPSNPPPFVLANPRPETDPI